MINYYFLGSSLPSLQLRAPLEMHFSQLMELYENNLTPKDYAKCKTVRLLVDLVNVKEFLRQGPFDSHGNFTIKEFEDNLLNEKNFPIYLFDFLNEYRSKEDQLKNFLKVFSKYFSEEIQKAKGFLKQYLVFERQLRLLLTAHRAKKLRRDLANELKFEDLTEPFIAYLIAAKDAPSLEMPLEFKDLNDILIKSEISPLKQFQLLIEYRIKKFSEFAEDKPFTIDGLLLYMVTLMLIEKWNELDEKAGEGILNKIIKEIA